MARPLPYPTLPPERHEPPWSASGAPASALDDALAGPLMEVGRLALARFGDPGVVRKEDGTPVTEADLDAQALLVDWIRRIAPGDAIQAEEGLAQPGGPRTWMVDPLDGTAAFSEGLAHWGPCVALLEAGRVAAGALWMPRIREHYYFEAGLGAFRNGAPLRSSPWPVEAPGKLSVLYVPSRLHAGARVDWPGKLRCLGSVAAHLALVAAGAAAAVIVPGGWKPWDTALGLALIDAVGGQAVLPDGGPLDPERHAGRPFAAGSPAALAWLGAPGRLTLLPGRSADAS